MEIVTKFWVEWLCGIVAAALALAYRSLSKRAKEDRAEQAALREGVKALLRDRLIQAYNHYTREGACPIYARQNVEMLYAAYHALGGNGTVTGLREKLLKLPTEPIKGKENEI